MLYTNTTLLDLELESGLAALSTATVKEIIIQKPDGSNVAVAAGVTGTKLTFAVLPNATTYNLPGVYQFQGKYEIAGRVGYTEIVERIFYAPLVGSTPEEFLPAQANPGDMRIFENGQWININITELAERLNNIPTV